MRTPTNPLLREGWASEWQRCKEIAASESDLSLMTARTNSRSSSQRLRGPMAMIRSRRQLRSNKAQNSPQTQSLDVRIRWSSSRSSSIITRRNLLRDWHRPMRILALKSLENSSHSWRLKRVKLVSVSREPRLLRKNHQRRAHRKNRQLKRDWWMTKTCRLWKPPTHSRVPPRAKCSKRYRKSRVKRKTGWARGEGKSSNKTERKYLPYIYRSPPTLNT